MMAHAYNRVRAALERILWKFAEYKSSADNLN